MDDSGERRIVVGVDGSQHSEQALRWGVYLAAALQARLDAVAAWEYPQSFGWAAVTPEWDPAADTAKILDETVQAVFGTEPPSGLHLLVREGGAARVLMSECEGATMVVVGSRSHGGFAGLLLGSVSAKVTEHSRAPC